MTVIRVLKYSLVTALVVSALVLTTLRLLLPQLSDYHELIQQRISEAAGQPVRFENISARMVGFRPELKLDRVSVFSANDDHPILQFDHLLLRISLPLSLLRGELSPTLVRLAGTEFSVMRKDGRIVVVGLQGADSVNRQSSDELVDWLLHRRNLEVTGTRLHYRDVDQDIDLSFSAAVLRLVAQRDGLRVSGRVSFVGTDAAGSLEVVSFLQAREIAELSDASWSIYLNVDELHRDEPIAGDIIVGGNLDLDGWVFGKGSVIDWVDGDLTWVQPLLAEVDELPMIRGKALRAAFDLSPVVDGWHARLKNIEFESTDGQWQGEQLIASYADSMLWVDGGEVDLAFLTRLLTGLLPEGHRFQPIVRGLAPEGRLSNLKADLGRADDGSWSLSALQAELHDVGINSYKKIPAVSALSGVLLLTPKQGRIDIDSTDFGFWLPGVFRQALEFEQLRAAVDWQVNKGVLVARLHHLDGGNNDLELRAKGVLELSEGESPILQLVGEVDEFDIEQISRYLPVGVMPPAVVRWLDSSLLGGRLVRAGVVWDGTLNEFPYDQDDGRFEVTGEVEGGVLDYVPGKYFPIITDIDAHLSFVGARMEISGQSGLIFDSELSEVSVVIEDLRRKGNYVTVVGKVDGSLANGLKYVHESPLEGPVGRHLQDLSVTGGSHLELALDIPLKKGEKVTVDGDLRLVGNGLQFSNTRIDLEHVSGRLKFDEKGIDAKELSATLFGGPATVSVESSPSTGLRLSGGGTLRVEQVAAYLGWQAFNVADGKSVWQSLLTIDKNGVDLTVDADLSGVKIHLPPPVAKGTGEEAQLKLHLDCECARPQAPLNLSLSIDDEWFVDMVLGRETDKATITRGVIATLPGQPMPQRGVLVTGSLPEIDFEPWQQWIGSLPEGSGKPVIDQVDAKIKRFDIFGQKFPDLQVQGKLTGGRWGLSMASAQVEGDLVYQMNPARLELNLGKLSLVTDPEKEPAGERSGFGNIPVLDISIQNLLLNSRPLGALSLNAELHADTLVLDAIKLDAGHSQLSGNGRWRTKQTEAGVFTEHSWFTGELSSSDFGDALTLLGYPQAVAGGSGKALWQLDWPSSPQQFSVDLLSGELAVDAEDGSLLAIEPGLGRLFGLLRFSTLQRRMSLDFRDVVGVGFIFDDFAAKVTAKNGQAELQRVKLKGPAAEIRLTGQIELANRELNLRAGVVPRVSDSMTLAASIASLGLGAAVYVGQKLLGNQIDSVTERNYRITGSIDEPDVAVIDESRIKKLLGNGRDSTVP